MVERYTNSCTCNYSCCSSAVQIGGLMPDENEDDNSIWWILLIAVLAVLLFLMFT